MMSEPRQHNLLEGEKQTAVVRDGLPRVARYLTAYDDGTTGETQHVLYWEAPHLRSMEAAAWLAQRGPLPADPTPEESAAAIAALQQATATDAADAAALRQRVLGLANSAVGIQIDALTAGQVRALMALLLWRAGALDKTGAIKPLVGWLNN